MAFFPITLLVGCGLLLLDDSLIMTTAIRVFHWLMSIHLIDTLYYVHGSSFACYISPSCNEIRRAP